MDWRAAERAFDDEVAGRRTLARAFEASAERFGDADAQRYKGGVYDRSLAPGVVSSPPAGEWGSLTYAEMRSIVRRLAAGLRELGVREGDRVGLFAETRMEWAQCDFGALAAGAVVTTVYPGSSPRQVGHLLGDAGATAAIVQDAERLERVRAVEDDLDLSFVVVMDAVDADGEDLYTLAELHDLGAEAFDERAYEGWLDARGPDDLASLIYTSGTTGRPKGVELTHWNFKANVDQCRARFGPREDKGDTPVIDAGSRTVSFLPLAHVFERLAGHFLMFASGATVAYAESPDTLREDFAAVRPTVGTSVPRVYEKIYAAIRDQAAGSGLRERVFEWAIGVGREHADADDPGAGLRLRYALADRLVFSRVKEALGGRVEFLISGGGSLSADLCRLYHGMGLPVLEGYGLTETAPVVSVNPPEAPRIGTIGPPLPDVAVRLDASVVDPETFEDAEGEVGELIVKGPNVARGYWNNPDATAEAFPDSDPVGEGAGVDGRWFRTGDVVERDADGYLTFLERRKELIVLSTGKNLAPTPIEDAFVAYELVEQAMVVGDERKFTGALLVPNLEAVREWAAEEGIDLPDDPAAVCADERVRGRIGAVVEEVNEGFEPHETIKDFRLVPEEFTEENGLLTPTLKKKRREILDRHATEVESIYAEG